MASLKKNFIYNILYQVLIAIIPLILSPYTSRVFGAASLGTYSYTFCVANYFVLFASLGVTNYGNRSIARVRRDKVTLSRTFFSIYTFQAIVCIISIYAYMTYLIIYVEVNLEIATIQLLLVISNLFDITWFFFGIEEFKITVTRNTVIKIFTVALVFLFVKTRNDLIKYTFIMSAGTLLGQISTWPFLRKRIYFVKPTCQEVIQHIKPNLFLFIPVLAGSLFSMMDKIMLGKLSNVTQLCYYENAEKIINIPKSFIRVLGTVMLPRISNLVAENKVEESKKYLSKTILYVAFASGAMAFGVAAVASVFSPIFWGKDFSDCGELIMYLSFSLVFSLWGNILRTQYLIPNKMDKEYTYSLVIGAISNVMVNALLIGKMGALGSVIGTVFAEFILMSYQFWAVSKKISIIYYYQKGLIFYFFGLIMFVVIKVIQSHMTVSVISLLLQILIGAVVYLTLSIIYIMLSKNHDIVEIKDLIKHRVTRKYLAN